MIHKQIFVCNGFQENSILLYDESGECVVIDPGFQHRWEEEEFLHFVSSHSLKPVAVLNTHCHVDHLFGNQFLYEEYGLLPRCHQEDLFLLKDAPQQARLFGVQLKPSPLPVEFINDGEEIYFGNSSFRAIHVPGHSPGGLAFYAGKDGFLVSGDSLFKGSIGRSDFIGGDGLLLVRSIKEKLLVLDEKVEVFPGHGPSTTIGQEKLYNPYFSGPIL